MNNKRLIYYAAFPGFIFLLCLFTYNLGYKRGVSDTKHEKIAKVMEELENTDMSEGSTLTYYQELHSKKNPLVEQINQDEKNKNAEAKKTTVPTVIEKQTVKTEKTPAPKTSGSTMAVQVGAFTDLGKADELTDRLKNSGFDAFTKSVQSKGMELFRVLVSADSAQTSDVQSKLSAQGYKNTFVVTK
jgi:cell division protein FtsN